MYSLCVYYDLYAAKSYRLNHNKQSFSERGRIAQWIALSLRTLQPQVQYSAFPRIFSLDVVDIIDIVDENDRQLEKIGKAEKQTQGCRWARSKNAVHYAVPQPPYN